MPLLDILRTADGGRAISDLAARAGVEPDRLERAIGVIAPELASRVERNTLSRGGLADIVELMGRGYQAYLRPADLLGNPNAELHGNAVLATILGGKEQSRAIAARAARASGLAQSQVQELLPYIAGMSIGGLAQQAQSGFGDIFSKLPRPPADAGRDGGFSTGTPGGRGTLPGGDGGFSGQSPLPVPGGMPPSSGGGGGFGFPAPREGGSGLPDWFPGPQNPRPAQGDNPYGDLGDILRRGGGGGGGTGGGALWSIVRQVLGAALGFQSRGIVGWIIRFVLYRWGWTILQRVLGRVLMGR